MGGNSLIINSSPSETRVALLENGQPVEVYIERHQSAGLVGNIYRGRVVRVLPGMQAAFVELGLERTGFLYVNDALPRAELSNDSGGSQEGRTEGGRAEGGRGRPNRLEPLANIADVIKEGQEILVQVQKEPIGTKGARLTRHVTMPGRHLVYMPFYDHIGVSHRIEDPDERARLKAVFEENGAAVGGFIVRTAGEGVSSEELSREARMLEGLWTKIEKEGSGGACPRLIFADLDLAVRAVRDLFNESVESVEVDRESDFSRIQDFIGTFEPERQANIHLYGRAEPIFDFFGIEVEIQRALERRVWLKSGGYIVIDQAEALCVIDVNSGRYVGKSNLEDTITQINLEAVKEAAFQLRLRNIGGIIIIDFIDMAKASNREKVHASLEQALARDRAKSSIVRMSEIGLVEMTRKRVRESLGESLSDTCPYCNGRGRIKSEQTVANEILRAISRALLREHSPTVLVNMHPGIADYLYANESQELVTIEKTASTNIIPVARDGYHREQFEIVKGSRN